MLKSPRDLSYNDSQHFWWVGGCAGGRGVRGGNFWAKIVQNSFFGGVWGWGMSGGPSRGYWFIICDPPPRGVRGWFWGPHCQLTSLIIHKYLNIIVSTCNSYLISNSVKYLYTCYVLGIGEKIDRDDHVENKVYLGLSEPVDPVEALPLTGGVPGGVQEEKVVGSS